MKAVKGQNSRRKKLGAVISSLNSAFVFREHTVRRLRGQKYRLNAALIRNLNTKQVLLFYRTNVHTKTLYMIEKGLLHYFF